MDKYKNFKTTKEEMENGGFYVNRNISKKEVEKTYELILEMYELTDKYEKEVQTIKEKISGTSFYILDGPGYCGMLETMHHINQRGKKEL